MSAVAVVTGAAQGIGKETALLLAEKGYSVTVNDINGDGARRTVAEITERGGQAHVVEADVGVEDEVRRMIEETASVFGRIDVLVNNAVVYDHEVHVTDLDIVSTPQWNWERTFAVNFHGAVYGARHAIPVMLKNGGGTIVNVGSTSGFSGDTVHVAYAASMAAKYSLTRSIAASHGKAGIRCAAVATGLVLSPTARKNLSPDKLAAYDANLLVPDFAEPRDVAETIVFLASPGAKYITGQTIIVDGGFQAHQPWHAQNHIVHPETVR
ncbi:SDR family NAD(P)-dependent oxidoreductase [Amycolatopsis silviterrae]|uniref:SDR family NAD(P)-dependent oxidoreductase n=1 Tax=Amycolatopsis silviterrae TaxID=1656914 RepID=A0ABW5H836_9PSEU